MFVLPMFGMLGFLSACKDNDDPEVENAGLYAIDRGFLMQAAQSNVTEVALGNIVIQKSNDASVKDYASMMIAQHTTAQNELMTLGSTKRWTVQEPAE
jgi:putative membrane protein